MGCCFEMWHLCGSPDSKPGALLRSGSACAEALTANQGLLCIQRQPCEASDYLRTKASVPFGLATVAHALKGSISKVYMVVYIQQRWGDVASGIDRYDVAYGDVMCCCCVVLFEVLCVSLPC